MIRRRLLKTCLFVCGLVAVGIIYEQTARRRATHATNPPGKLVSVAGKDVHLHCIGVGSPIVVLEAGAGSPSSVWSGVQRDIATFARVCSYDRAGYQWSEPRDGPRDGRRIAAELHALLRAASENPPYVLVGHSMGGPLISIYTGEYPEDVAGLVYVDPTHVEAVEQAPAEQGLSRIARAVVQRLLIETGLARLLVGLVGDDMPVEAARSLRTFGPQHLDVAARELRHVEEVLAQATALRTLGDRPTVVLTAGKVPAGLDDKQRQAAEAELGTWLRLHETMSKASTRGVHRVVHESTHFIQWDQPGAVVSAIHDVVIAARGTTQPR